MKPPATPSRFQTTQRHYHRHQADDPTAWDNWVGTKKKSTAIWKWLGITLAILAFATVVGTLIYQMR